MSNYSAKEEDTPEDNVDTKMPPKLTSTTVAVRNNKLTSTNLVDTHHQCSHIQQTQIILHSLEDGISRNYSHCERRKLKFMRKFLKMTLRKNLCLQHQRIMRTANRCKSDHSTGLSEPSSNKEFQKMNLKLFPSISNFLNQ